MVIYLLGERIKIAAKAVGGQTKLAELCPVSPTTMAAYISGKNSPQIDMIERISGLTGKSVRWLIFGDDHIQSDHILSGFSEEPSPFTQNGGNNRRAPLYEARASAGSGAVVLSQSVIDYFDVPIDWLPKDLARNGSIGVMQADGESMEPTIRDGDLLIVRFDIDRIRKDGVYVVSFDGEIRVKRLSVNPGEVTMSSDNELHKAVTMTREDAERRLIVHGQVFWSGGALRSR